MRVGERDDPQQVAGRVKCRLRSVEVRSQAEKLPSVAPQGRVLPMRVLQVDIVPGPLQQFGNGNMFTKDAANHNGQVGFILFSGSSENGSRVPTPMTTWASMQAMLTLRVRTRGLTIYFPHQRPSATRLVACLQA